MAEVLPGFYGSQARKERLRHAPEPSRVRFYRPAGTPPVRGTNRPGPFPPVCLIEPAAGIGSSRLSKRAEGARRLWKGVPKGQKFPPESSGTRRYRRRADCMEPTAAAGFEPAGRGFRRDRRLGGNAPPNVLLLFEASLDGIIFERSWIAGSLVVGRVLSAPPY